MLSVDALERAVTDLFHAHGAVCDYDPDEVEEMLGGIDFHALTQVVRHKMGTVYSFTTQGKLPKSFNYRGPELFGQEAVCLYEEMDQVSMEEVTTASRYYELWLLEDMTFMPVVRVAVSWGDKEYSCEYRVSKDCEPWETDMSLDLENFSANLMNMCDPCYESEIPVYEL